MKKHILTFLGLFIFIMIMTPHNVFATVTSTGYNNLNKSQLYYYNIQDATDYFLGNEYNLTKITVQANTVWYNFYSGATGSTISRNDNLYSPSFIKLYSGMGNIPFCTSQCDLMFSFYYGFATNTLTDGTTGDYQTATNYLNKARQTSTNFSGIKIVGTDINDQPKEFYCTGQYVIGTLGQDRPYNKFFATCPTSNFKNISYVLIDTGWSAVPNTTNMSLLYYIDKLTWEVSDYTGTQDGLGGSNSSNENPTTEEILDSITDDSIDSSFQNSTMNSINSQLASNNVISDLLLLPVRMYQSILNSLGSNTCQPFQLGSLYGTNLTLPCIQVQNYIGSSLWTTIDLIFCGIFVLVIRKKFVDIFNNMTNLKNGGNEIE